MLHRCVPATLHRVDGTNPVLNLPADLARPDPALDPYLDAFGRAAARFGVRRTTARDIAQELGVDRTTVFRNVGRLDELQSSYLARELHRLIDGVIADIPASIDGPAIVIEVAAAATERARAHPVLEKVLADEPDVVGELLPRMIEPLIERGVAALAPGLALAAGVGMVHCPDPDAVASWVVRYVLTTLVAPPTDVRRELDAVLRPLLSPPT